MINFIRCSFKGKGLWITMMLLGMIRTTSAQDSDWTIKGLMPTPRAAFCTSVVEEIVYVVGGDTGQAVSSNQVEAYDPSNNTWTSLAPIPTARYVFSCGVVDGKIYAIGGQESLTTPDLSLVEVYDPVTNSWSTAANMLTARRELATSAWNGKIYAIGGVAGPGTAGKLDVVEVFDPATNTWTSATPMPTARWGLRTSVANNLIYTIGGVTDDPTVVAIVEAYDPGTDSWTTVASLPTGKVAFSLSELNGKMYVIGGSFDSFPYTMVTASVEEYDPVTDIWTSRSYLNFGRSFLSSCTVNGKIYAFGGQKADLFSGIIAEEIEVFNPLVTGVGLGNKDGLTTFTLHQNYPNPFNPTTTISYFIPKSGYVELKVSDMLGKEIQTIVNEFQSAGSYSFNLNAGKLSSGLYIYKLQAGNYITTKKMLLLR